MTTATEATDDTDRLIAGLRELADFIEANQQFAHALDNERFLLPVSGEPERFFELARQLGGHREKQATDGYFGVSRFFGGIELHVYAPRNEVCERVQIGERVEISTAVVCVHCSAPIFLLEGVWKHVGAADEDSYHLCATDADDTNVATPPAFTEITESVEPVYEWKCSPILDSSAA